MRVIGIVGGLLSVALLGCGLFYWLRDEPQSAEVGQWLAQAQLRPGSSAAYLFLAGLDAPPRHSPAALGQARLHEYQQWQARHGFAEPGFTPAPQTRLPLPAGKDFCPVEKRACFAGLLERQEQLPALVAEHGALLNRYRYLLTLGDFRTLQAPSAAEPVLPLTYLVRGQQLLSLRALSLALSGDGATAQALLLEDHAGVRRYLAQADQLVLKMVLTSMLNRNLEWLARLQRMGLTPHAAPLAPLTVAERTLRPALQREFLGTATLLAELREDDIPGLLEEASMFFEYKPQMTINASLIQYQQTSNLSETTPVIFQQLVSSNPEISIPHTGLRNRVGNILLSIANPDFVAYVGRLMDIDSKIRLVSLSAHPQPGAQLLAQVAGLPEAVSPYLETQRPFLDKQGRLCFDGPLPARESGRCVPL